MIRVLVANDHQAVREGVRTLLADEREISVVGEADDGSTALAMARALRPDLIVLDDAMPSQSGLEVARTITGELPSTAIVFLARDPGLRGLAIAAGATAFVPKDAPSEELLRAIRASAAALTARQQLGALKPEGRRVVELLLGSRVMTEEQVQEALAKRVSGESLATTVVRLGLIGQPELADILARASDTPLVSLAPYPEISAPIDPTESRLSSPRLVDPVDRDAARGLPFDVARGLGVVITTAASGQGVLAMADPLDDIVFAEAERHSRLRLTRVTATADDIHDTLDRVWNGGGSQKVIWTGSLLGRITTSAVLFLIVVASLGGFFFATREALAPRYGFSLFALLCGIFFFLYALKYYVTIASVILITLFGDPAKFQGRGGHANGNGNGNGLKADGQTNGNGQSNGQHKEGYRTLRGENLSEGGSVQVTDPWQKMGEIRLPADRQPFVSVQLALYNEKRVVDRLLEACTSFDYENYEVIVVDDSTDETVELLKRWQDHPRVRVIHRQSRKGFKGGALQEALRRMNPKAEYVMIFDADFVPPADAIWHFLDYFGRLAKAKNGNGNGHAKNGNGHNGHGAPQNGDRVAAVQGYQWHMLNASENWITKGVRAEFSGSYVLERAGQELFGAMKMISGSVYMIRADVLRKLGWSTSITEDWELTIRLYLAGYKVLYTPYIQAPAECVSKVSRLIKQRMRWAEGHTYNVKKYFWQVLRSPNLTWQEKLEFVYYAPYYLQSVLFTFATLAWIIGVLILGQKLPMWGEVFGWSLVVSNALALPLMNLTGVLLEGSLRRDALGVISFIGLSWLLVPFQAYASIKAFFERKEGGWVRTPKSGHVTETLERFHLARLMPWELPRRRRGQAKATSGTGRLAAAAVVVLAAAGIITVGALSIRAAATSGIASETDLAVPALLGTGIPLAILALGWLRLRRRVTALVLAFTLGLGTNIVYVAHAVPANAVTDNSSVFTFARTTGYSSPMSDMKQGYTPSGAQAFCPTTYGSGGGGYSWTCRYASDVFSAGQTLSAGNATAALYLENDNPVPTLVAASGFGAGSASSINIPKPTGVASGDVLIATISIRGGTNNGTITKPSASWNLADRIDSLTSITLAVYSLVAGASEPASYTWSWSTGNQKSGGGIQAFRGVDNVTPIDDHAGLSETTGSSTHIAPSVNATYGNEMRVVAFADSTNFICNSPWDFQLDVSATSTGGGAGSTDATDSAAHSVRFLPPGPTGTVTGSCGNNDIGATAQLTLRSAAGASRTCALTARLKLLTTIQAGATTTAVLNNGLSLSVNVPAGVASGDLLLATIGKTGSEFLGIPSGWTRVQHVGDSSTMDFAVFYHVVANGDPSSYAFSWTGSTNRYATGGITAYGNVDNDNPVDVNGTWGSGASSVTSFPAPTITTTAANEMIVTAYGVAADNTNWTAPAGMSERVDQVAGTGTTFVSVGQDDVLQSGPPAATGTKTATSNVAGGGGAITLALRPGRTLGSGTPQVNSPTAATLTSTTFATSAVTFAAGDQLELEVVAPNDSANCATWLSYDGGSQPSKLTVATIVPEGIAGLLLLAPALPFGARWWKRRRP